ncbi:MAG TPA: hypothetical protein VGG83_10740 [Trebonia sp.]
MTIYALPGQPVTLPCAVYNEDGPSGVLIDPASVQLDITYGTGSSDVAGPFLYVGASVPTGGQVYRSGVGLYAYAWQIPSGAAPGTYVATWTIAVTAGSAPVYGTENIIIGVGPATGSSDVGYWTGSLSYGPHRVPLGSVDANGTAWMVQSVTGLDGVPTSGGVVQRAGDHGGYATPQYYGPRPLTVTVHAAAASQALRDTARALLQASVPPNQLATFVYNEPVPKTMQVRRSGVLHESYPTLLDVIFTIGLIAPDPRKYGTSVYTQSATAAGQMLGITPPLTPPLTPPAQAASASIMATNNGNFGTGPLVTITGPITGPALYNQTSGMIISFSGLTLSATEQLVVDLLNRVATINGQPIAADVSSAWWRLAPGASSIVLAGADYAGSSMTITYSDAWM